MSGGNRGSGSNKPSGAPGPRSGSTKPQRKR